MEVLIHTVPVASFICLYLASGQHRKLCVDAGSVPLEPGACCRTIQSAALTYTHFILRHSFQARCCFFLSSLVTAQQPELDVTFRLHLLGVP